MGPPGCTASDGGTEQALNQISDKPEKEKEYRGYVPDCKEEKDIHNRCNSGPGISQEVGAQYTGYGPAGTYQGNWRIYIGQVMDPVSQNSAKQVEKKKTKMSQPVFDIITKDPEIKHVKQQMKPVPVQKSCCQKGRIKQTRPEEQLQPFRKQGRDKTVVKKKVTQFCIVHHGLAHKDEDIQYD